MSGDKIDNFSDIPPGCTSYDYGELSLPFTLEDTLIVNSIRSFLSEAEIANVQKIETIYYSPLFQNVVDTTIPGLRSYNTSFFFISGIMRK